MDIPGILEKKLDKPVAIFGGGISGNAVADFLRENGFSSRIYDRKATGAGARFDMAEASGHDLVVYSPGFPKNHPWKEVARRAGLLCLCEPDFAALFWQGTLPPIKRLPGETSAAFLARADNRLGLTA
ncbi:MAG: UDP-N-acetylmuramoylalanine--D-glutamate ligase, partial [Opitutales bacterium]|nr:UDP-N-acetylmuramoylalanine--D-glutamate ligase [Opitutales bacterium]